MKKFIITLFLFAALASNVFSQSLGEKLQNLSVTIKAGESQGSGVLVTRDNTNYVLTCAHTIEGVRKVQKFQNNSAGTIKTLTVFKPVLITQEIFTNGKKAGQIEIISDVIAYSSPGHGEDLCLLKLRHKVTDSSVIFYKGDQVPISTKLSHVGSYLGQFGSCSYAEGLYSQKGRVLNDKDYDQYSLPIFSGSSGGGVFILENGEYMGMVVRGAGFVQMGTSFAFGVPMKRIKEWTKNHNIEFILDETIKPDLSKVLLETLEPLEEEKEVKE